MDLSKLSPAPWRLSDTPSNQFVINGEEGWVCALAGFHSRTDDFEFIALARNAFDVMMRRKIFPIIRCGKWAVDVVQCAHVGGFDDPFSAIMAADEWLAENVETP